MQLAQDTSATVAWTELRGISNHPRHEFWDDGFSYLIVPTHPLQGHRQVTDTWLAELARRHGGRLATLDQGLAATHSDVAVLIP